jgi:hypothetical protein
VRHLHLHRPSAATIISLVALFFAMGGTAVAATGGNFILGKANTATSVSSLTNTKGTALSLSSTATTPPLKVSNSVQVPNLNASELDGQTSSAFLPATGTAVNSSELGGQPASAFLPATGTAANSSELGGTPASGYMHGGGNTTGARLTLSALPTSVAVTLLTGPGANLYAVCDPNGTGSGSAFVIAGNEGTVAGATALWWNKDGVGGNTAQKGIFSFVTPSSGSTVPYAVVVQVDNDTSVSTFTATEWFDPAGACHFTGQVVTTNG